MNINYYNPYIRQELELYHHGILGQRWGKKNGPPYPLGASDHSASEKKAGWRKSLDGGGQTRREARKYTRKLNRLDKNQVESVARYQRAFDKAARIERKLGYISNKEGYSKKYQKTNEKYKKAVDKAVSFEKKLKESEAETWRTIAELSEKGYSMDSEKVRRMALSGESAVGYAIAGLAGYMIVSAKNSKYSIQEGNKFKVRKTKDGEQQHTRIEQLRKDQYDGDDTYKEHDEAFYKNDKSEKMTNKSDSNSSSKNEGGLVYTQKEMQEKITTARNKDQWDLEFLERYNPDDYFKEWNQADAIKEYKKYLKDPYKYNYEPPTATNNFKNLSYEKREAAKNNVRRMSSQNIGRARTMLNAGDSYAEIAKRLGVSESTIWALFSAEG